MTNRVNTLFKKALTWVLQLIALAVFAQSPSLINYQGAARLADGTPLDNRTISIKFDIHQGSSTGSIVASETQTVQTNLLGLFTTQIGKSVNLGTINWQANSIFLQVSMDTSSDNNFTSLGTQQMVSVPYAMHASSVPSSYTNNILTIGSDTYALSPTIAVTPNTTLTVSGLGTVTSAGTNSFDINIPAPTFTNTGQTIISGSYPNYTVNTPTVPAAAIPTIVITNTVASSSTVTSSGNSFSINVPPPTFTNAGPATITGAYPNFTINSSAGTTYTNGAGISITSGSVIANTSPNITPTVAITTTASAGASVSSVGSSFSINVPAPTFTNAGPATITGAYPNFTINSSTGVTYTNGAGISITSGSVIANTLPHITPSLALTATAAAGPSVTSSGNSFSLNVPPPTFTNAGPATITGAYPNFTINSSTGTTYTNGAGISITSGSVITNTSPNITPTVAVTTTAAVGASVTSTGSSFNINVPAPSFTNAGPATITGSYPNYTINSTTATTYTNGAGISITSGSIITNAVPDQTVTFNNTGQTLITGTYPTFNIATPTVAAPPTIAADATGIATVSAGPNYTVGVQTPTFTNVSQNIITGSYPSFSVNTPTIANTSIALSATAAAGPSVGVVGTNSFNINIPPATSDWNILGNAGTNTVTNFIGTTDANGLNFKTNNNFAMIITANRNVGIGAPAPNALLEVAGTATTTSPVIKTSNTNAANVSAVIDASGNGTGPAILATQTNAALTAYAGSFDGGILTRGKNAAATGYALRATDNAAVEIFAARNDGFAGIGGNTTGFANTGLLVSRPGAFDNRVIITGGDNSNSYGGILTFGENLNHTQGMSIKLDAVANRLLFTTDVTGTTPVMSVGPYGAGAGVTIGNAYAFSAPPTNGLIVQAATGIGTNAPTATLHVVGTSRFVDGTQGAGKILTSDALGNASWVASGDWSLLGNAGTNTVTNFIGTTDNVALSFRVFNQKAGIIDPILFNSNFGYLSGTANTTGIDNVGMGYQTLNSSTIGSNNTAIGYRALSSNTNGNANSAVGSDALLLNTTGIFNCAVGLNALRGNTSGNNNSAYGRDALHDNSVGSGNVAVGYQAGFAALGSSNVFIGNSAGSTELGSNKFWLANSATSTAPLMYGDFTSGNIAIGTVNANASLQFNNAVVGRKIVFQEAANNDNQVYGLGLSINTLRYQVDASTANHVFFSGINSTTSQELMRIQGNRRVGINTSAPTATFEVTGTTKLVDGTQGLGKILTSDASGNASWQTSPDWSQIGNAGTNPATNFLGTTDAQAFRIRTNNIERLAVTSAGNVGIGTNAPAALLTIDNQSVTTRNGLHVLNGRDVAGSAMPVQFDATTNGQVFGTNTYGRILRLNNTALAFADHGIDQAGSYFISRSGSYNPNADFVINGAGYIGLGTSNPNAPLQLDNSVVNRKIVLYETANNDHQFYGFGINNSVLRFQVDGTGADHVFYAGTSATTSNELMRIKGNGNVVIGSSTATHKFQVFPSAIITNTEGQSNFFQNGNQGAAIYAESNDPGPIVYAQSFIAGWHPNSPFASNVGVWGNATGQGVNGYGMIATHGALGAPTTYVGLAGPSFAGVFSGNVTITGSIAKSSGTFKIDHPQDPANKYLYHSFVESPDMMNVYNGNVITDVNGDALVQLPAYFETLNIDFRYQLTVMGQFAQVIVAQEVINNQFKIKTDKPNVKVSWQVTGVRNDEYARANRVVPEVEKKGTEKGKYLHPDLFGFGREMQIVPDKAEGNTSNQGKK